MGSVRKYVSILVGIAAAFGAASPACASEYRSADDGNWHSAASWEILADGKWQPAAAPPSCGDTARILSGHTIIVNCTSSSITSLIVESEGQLIIDGCSSTQRVVLTVCGGIGQPSVSIASVDGVLLNDRFAELRFEATTIISGNGSLRGLDSDATIAIAPSEGTDATLTSSVTIHGALTIMAIGDGDGFFVNTHKVWADRANAAITLDSSLAGVTDSTAVGDCNFHRWEVSTQHAALRFGQGTTSLAGNFWVGPGKLLLDESVSTDGMLKIVHGGVIRPSLLPLACFSFDEHCGSDCPLILSPVCLLAICP